MFPTTCVDNFYKEPDKIREWALGLNYTPSENGNWPGKRSRPLHLIDNMFYQEFCKKFISIFYDVEKHNIKYSISTAFQIINPMDVNPNSFKNKGWIHQDDSLFAAIIYLTPEIEKDSGTSMFVPKQEITQEKLSSFNKNAFAKQQFFLGRNVDEEYYKENILKTNENFEETIRFNNLYNRLVVFDSNQWHAANNFYSTKKERLTQLVFVDKFEIDAQLPSDRIKNCSLL